MAKVKVISLLQPWAELVVMGAKTIETRSWNTKYRGELYIHASKKFYHNDIDLRHYPPFDKYITDEVFNQIKCGYIIGKVDLIDTFSTNDRQFCIGLSSQEVAFGDYSKNRFGWILDNPVKFNNPIEAKGSLSIWEYDLKEEEVQHA